MGKSTMSIGADLTSFPIAWDIQRCSQIFCNVGRSRRNRMRWCNSIACSALPAVHLSATACVFKSYAQTNDRSETSHIYGALSSHVTLCPLHFKGIGPGKSHFCYKLHETSRLHCRLPSYIYIFIYIHTYVYTFIYSFIYIYIHLHIDLNLTSQQGDLQ